MRSPRAERDGLRLPPLVPPGAAVVWAVGAAVLALAWNGRFAPAAAGLLTGALLQTAWAARHRRATLRAWRAARAAGLSRYDTALVASSAWHPRLVPAAGRVLAEARRAGARGAEETAWAGRALLDGTGRPGRQLRRRGGADAMLALLPWMEAGIAPARARELAALPPGHPDRPSLDALAAMGALRPPP